MRRFAAVCVSFPISSHRPKAPFYGAFAHFPHLSSICQCGAGGSWWGKWESAVFMRGGEGCINIRLLVWVNIWLLVGLMGGVGCGGVAMLLGLQQVGHLGVEIGEEGGGFIESLTQ